MAKASYKLSRELLGHTGDVRALSVGADGSVVSGSRDKTSILWKFNEASLIGNVVMTGPTNFVSSVCYINPNEKHPNGLILTGSNDNHLYIYNPGEEIPIHKIKAHENTICSLKASNRDNESFFTSSWDISAKWWSLNRLEMPRVTYLGHTAAVWCVSDLPNGSVITGSADKTVIVYLRDGQILHKLKGHTDCVRDIAIISDSEFLTCSNDAAIKHWSGITGDCLGSFYGHTNYIYSLSAVPGGSLVVSSGEDKTIRVWCNGEVDQTITLPTQSVWCVQLMPNKDIACGSSDGVVRIFTTCPDRYADSESLQKFEEAVANAEQSNDTQIGDLKLDNVPDASALTQPGRKDGETKLIKEGNTVKAYGWSQSQLQWNLIGDVTGGNPSNSGKQLYNGIEYDYVFSVDIQDGVPALKLPYNDGQDPWVVAQKFIDDNELSQLFLDQVANFIVKNSTPAQVVNSAPGFHDPFTGGSRYVPGGSSAPSVTTQPNPAPVVHTSNNSNSSSYFPMKNILKLEQGGLEFIHGKLKEFNSELKDRSIAEDKLEFVVKLATKQNEQAIEVGAINTLLSLLNWPQDVLFPVLDIARLAVLQENVNDKLCNVKLMALIRPYFQRDLSSTNQMLTFRLLANMLCHEAGEKLGLQYKDEILEEILNTSVVATKNHQVAMSTYILNLAVVLNKTNDSAGKSHVMKCICRLLVLLGEQEAHFRLLVALGTLLIVAGGDEFNKLATILRQTNNTLHTLQVLAECSEKKVANTAVDIMKLL